MKYVATVESLFESICCGWKKKKKTRPPAASEMDSFQDAAETKAATTPEATEIAFSTSALATALEEQSPQAQSSSNSHGPGAPNRTAETAEARTGLQASEETTESCVFVSVEAEHSGFGARSLAHHQLAWPADPAESSETRL